MKPSSLLAVVTLSLIASLTACGTDAPVSPGAGGASSTSVPPPSSAAAPAVETTTTEAPADGPIDEPTPEPSFDGKASDFEIGIKILRKKCFGSAGCNITYRIDPQYVGSAAIPETGTVEVTYVVKGLEDGDAINTFTIEGEKASFQEEEDGTITSPSKKLSSKVTDVSYSPED